MVNKYMKYLEKFKMFEYAVKYCSVKDGEIIDISQYPNFSASGSISGMKKKYYGKDATLIRCGSYIYNVPKEIYDNIDDIDNILLMKTAKKYNI